MKDLNNVITKKDLNEIFNDDPYDKTKYTKVRAWILKQTDKAILLKGHHFKAKWIPIKYLICLSKSKRDLMLGVSYAWLIEKWLLK